MTDTPTDTTTDTNAELDSTMTRTSTPVVLVVEDDSAYAELHREWLADDYDVRVARDGAGALERIDGTVDVVLLDRKLPDMRGRAVLEEIRSRGVGCQVVVVSAIDPGVDALDLGFDDYLTKPTAEEDLVAAVERSLARMEYATRHREVVTLAAKLATIEANADVDELEANPEYADLRARFEELAEEFGQLAPGDDEYRDLYRTKLQVLFESAHAASVDH